MLHIYVTYICYIYMLHIYVTYICYISTLIRSVGHVSNIIGACELVALRKCVVVETVVENNCYLCLPVRCVSCSQHTPVLVN